MGRRAVAAVPRQEGDRPGGTAATGAGRAAAGRRQGGHGGAGAAPGAGVAARPASGAAGPAIVAAGPARSAYLGMLPRLPTTWARTFGLSAAGWTLLALARTGARVAGMPRPPDEAALLFARTVLASAPWIVATPLLVLLAERLPWRRGARLRSLAIHLGVLLAFGAVESSWALAAFSWSGQSLTVGPIVFHLSRVDQTLCISAW